MGGGHLNYSLRFPRTRSVRNQQLFVMLGLLLPAFFLDR